jgi:two-component system KDP operon response regulator KdpE
MHDLGDNTSSLASDRGAPSRSRREILCIDDEPELERIWRIRLSRYGIDVVGATSGADGFAATLARKPDLILLDFCMPDQNGNEVLARLRCHPATREIPVWLLTGGDATTARRQAFDHRADDYLTKPLDLDEFMQKARATLPGWTTMLSAIRPTRSAS